MHLFCTSNAARHLARLNRPRVEIRKSNPTKVYERNVTRGATHIWMTCREENSPPQSDLLAANRRTHANISFLAVEAPELSKLTPS